MHEVVVLTDVVAKVCAALDVGALVDLGSGKGYLSQVAWGGDCPFAAYTVGAFQDVHRMSITRSVGF